MGNGETIPLSRLKSGIKPFPYAQFAVFLLNEYCRDIILSQSSTLNMYQSLNCSYMKNKLTTVKVVQFRSDLDNYLSMKKLWEWFFSLGKKKKSKKLVFAIFYLW